MSSLTRLTVDASGRVTGQVVDYLEVGFKPTTMVYTIYDNATRTIINSRDSVDCLSSVDASGNLSMLLARADHVLAVPSNESEEHTINFKWTYNAGVDAGVADLVYIVEADLTP
jgi:hypothetical protein